MATEQERIAIAVLQTDVTTIKDDIKDVKSDIKTIKTAIEYSSSTADTRYAAKWVQTAVAFVIGLMVTGIITALMALIIIPAKSNTTVSQPNTSSTTTTTTPTGSKATTTTNRGDSVTK